MKLPLETWLNEYSLPPDARLAFQEAVICYKSGAYRTAVLFSYLGLAQVIRSCVLRAQRPASRSGGEWAQRLAKLRGCDRWDKQVFELTQMTAPNGIFDISAD